MMQNPARLPALSLLAAAIAFLATLALVHASVESGMNDDWSFIRTAQDAAATGKLRYNGWSAPLIGFQAYWGALFIRVFGFSFLTVRASVYLLTLLFLPVLRSLFRSAGLSERQALFGMLTFLLSPLNLPNLTTFMTDMPAFLLFAAALLGAMNALSSRVESQAIKWIAITTACSILSGSIRQIYWLAGVCFLVALGITRMRTTRGRLFTLLCLCVTVCFAVLASNWLGQQPFVPADTTIQDLQNFSWHSGPDSSFSYLGRYFIGATVLCIPFSLLFVRRTIARLALWRHLVVLCVAGLIIRHLVMPLPWLGNTLSQDGVILRHTISLGEKPEVLPASVVIGVASFGVISALYAIAALAGRFRWPNLETPQGRLMLLVASFIVTYLPMLAIRSLSFGLYDRYLVPVVFCLGLLSLAYHAQKNATIGGTSWFAAAVFALYAIATTHDYFAEARAKLEATKLVMRSGYKREDILSGFEFDSWTQVERAGYVNNELLENPNGAYREMDNCNGEDDVQAWWRSLTPEVKARYVISLTPVKSLLPAEFAPLEYQRWLPFTKSYIYVNKAPPGVILTCDGG